MNLVKKDVTGEGDVVTINSLLIFNKGTKNFDIQSKFIQPPLL